jgi:serine/threonine-protein kinase HipA
VDIHREAMMASIGLNSCKPTDMRQRVQQMVDALVANRAKITAEAITLPFATQGYVVHRHSS